MRRWLRFVAVCWLCTTLLTGCGQQRTARYRIVVIPKGTTHAFWRAIHAGALQAAREHGDVEIVWQGPGREDDRQEQQDIVQRFTTEGVDAIVLAPTDRRTLVAPVLAALEKGIPVVIIDSGLEATKSVEDHPKYLGYVATDNREGGRQAAARLAEALGGRGDVLMLRYQAGSQSTELREAGFLEGMEQHPGVEVRVAEQEAGATVDSAQRVAEQLLEDHADVDGVFTPNESSTVGMLRALQTRGRAQRVKLVGFDGSDILIDALESGAIDGLVLQDPFDMGYQAVRRALAALDGRRPGSLVLNTGLRVATRENLDDPAVRKMYRPDLSLLKD